MNQDDYYNLIRQREANHLRRSGSPKDLAEAEQIEASIGASPSLETLRSAASYLEKIGDRRAAEALEAQAKKLEAQEKKRANAEASRSSADIEQKLKLKKQKKKLKRKQKPKPKLSLDHRYTNLRN